MTDNEALRATLRTLVGETHVLTDGDLTAYEQDWRKRERGRALAVVRPGTTEEVAAVVKACAAAGVSLVPQGGNTGMVVGSIPDASGTQVLLSLQRLNRIRTIDSANLTVTVEAGCVLQTLQEACEKEGYLFPLAWPLKAVAPLAATWPPTRAARRWCATATPASCVWVWK